MAARLTKLAGRARSLVPGQTLNYIADDPFGGVGQKASGALNDRYVDTPVRDTMSFPPPILDHFVVDVRDKMDEAVEVYRRL